MHTVGNNTRNDTCGLQEPSRSMTIQSTRCTKCCVQYESVRTCKQFNFQEPGGTMVGTRQFVGSKARNDTCRFQEPGGTRVGTRQFVGNKTRNDTCRFQEPGGTRLGTRQIVGNKARNDTCRFQEPSGTRLGTRHFDGEHQLILAN